MPRLVALGDSLTQGFHSGAITQTEWSFPAMIARSIGLNVPHDFRIPRFPGSGLPLNIERLLRSMEEALGKEISLDEWLLQFPQLFAQFADEVEDTYERGEGARPATFGGVYHNLACWGFRVADSFTLTSGYADSVVNAEEGFIADDFLGLPAAPMYRSARRVLNPKLRPQRESWTMLRNLREIVETEGPIETLIIWLGSNDCLGTVMQLKIADMPDIVEQDPVIRRRWNLTHPRVFDNDFRILVEQVHGIVGNTTHVFVGTIPHVTIPPVTKGIGEIVDRYYPYYARFIMNKDQFDPLIHWHLAGEEARTIDTRIDSFNASIEQHVATQGPNWHVVPLGEILDDLAVKRNNLEETPDVPLRTYYANQPDHPLLKLDLIPSVLLLKGDNSSNRTSGGLFGLDSIHPAIIGYGIIAEAFLRKMQAAGIPDADPARLDWSAIIANDSLQHPPRLWDDVLSAGHNHSTIWDVLFRVIG